MQGLQRMISLVEILVNDKVFGFWIFIMPYKLSNETKKDE